MAQTLTPSQFVKDGAGLNITSLLAAPTQTVLTFANSGREILIVAPAATLETVTVNVGVTVLGQAVSNFSEVSLTNGSIYAFGPFDSPVNQPGTGLVQITLSTITAITVALVQTVGAA